MKAEERQRDPYFEGGIMKLGFIGLGNMGKPMAANLLKAGHQLMVYDIRKEAARELLDGGAVWADSPKKVAEKSEVVLTSLPGPGEVEEVALGVNGILAGSPKGSAYIDLSTNSPAVIKKIAIAAKEKGVAVLDAPVSGGIPGAKARTLAIMVGGDKMTFDRCSELFKAIASNVFYVGEIGSGNAIKLINAMMLFVNLYGSVECLLLAKKLGLDLKTVFEVIKESSGDSFSFHQKLPRSVLVGNFEPGFALRLAYKDIDLGTRMAREAEVPIILASIVQQKLLEAKARGWEDRDWTCIALPLEEALNTEIRY
jgi:3-hydroxyisobutyrate dehydrogenase